MTLSIATQNDLIRLHGMAAEALMYEEMLFEKKSSAESQPLVGFVLTIAAVHYSLPNWVKLVVYGGTLYKMATAVSQLFNLRMLIQASPVLTSIKGSNYDTAVVRVKQFNQPYMFPYHTDQKSKKEEAYVRASSHFFAILSEISYRQPRSDLNLQEVERLVDHAVFARWTDEINQAQNGENFRLPKVITNAALMILFKIEAIKDPSLDPTGYRTREYMALVIKRFPPTENSLEQRFTSQVLATKNRQEIVQCIEFLTPQDFQLLKTHCLR